MFPYDEVIMKIPIQNIFHNSAYKMTAILFRLQYLIIAISQWTLTRSILVEVSMKSSPIRQAADDLILVGADMAFVGHAHFIHFFS